MQSLKKTLSKLLFLFTPFLLLAPAQAQTADPVLYASEAPVRVGAWSVVTDATAAGGQRLANRNVGLAKVTVPLADPADYFEMTFYAEAGKAYRLWLRGKAESDNYNNDSVYVQFSGSLNASRAADYRIGTTSAATVILEDCHGCGLSDWGWQDNGYDGLGSLIYFAQTGTQTIRVQAREDGLSIDQIILSKSTYLNTSPGSFKNDTVILYRDGGSTPPPANQSPTVKITPSVTSGNAPLSVKFTATASDPDGSIAGYSWNFGNGQTSSSSAPTATYSSAGTFTAKLTVTDNDGATASASLPITVTVVQSSGSTKLKVLSWNIEKGRGTDNVYDLNRTADWIARLKADVALLCEVMMMSKDDQSKRLADMLRQKTGVTWYYKFFPKYDGDDEGNLILSKYPLQSTSGKYLSYQRSIAQARISVAGRTINLFATHLDNTSVGLRLTQVNQLLPWVKSFSGLAIIGGDFNAWPDQSSITTMMASYQHSWDKARANGTATSYPDNPVGWTTRTRKGMIDYVFYSLNQSYLTLDGVHIPDSRDLSNKNVSNKLGTLDDKGVRPSDHNHVVATFTVR